MSTREHGVWGYREMAVGRFGEPPDHQVAKGGGPDVAPETKSSSRPNAILERTDEEVHADIAARIHAAGIEWSGVEVLVTDGAVSLRGSVLSADHHRRLLTISTAVPGVKTIDDRVVVRREGWLE